MSKKYSLYIYDLEGTEKSRYCQKLDKFGEIDDPYLQQPTTVGKDWRNWPSVEYPDIYNYTQEKFWKHTKVLKLTTIMPMAGLTKSKS